MCDGLNMFLSLVLSGLAAERPGEGVCSQRLRDLQHATGAAEITNRPRAEEERKRDEKTEMTRALDCQSLLPFLLVSSEPCRHCAMTKIHGETVHDEAAAGASLSSVSCAIIDY